MKKKLKFWQVLLLAITFVSVLNLSSYFTKNHTMAWGDGTKYNSELHNKVFIENLKYYNVPYEIDREGFIRYTKSSVAKVHEIKKMNNYKLVPTYDLGYEIKKLEGIEYEVLTFDYPEPNKTLVMWHEKN